MLEMKGYRFLHIRVVGGWHGEAEMHLRDVEEVEGGFVERRLIVHLEVH